MDILVPDDIIVLHLVHLIIKLLYLVFSLQPLLLYLIRCLLQLIHLLLSHKCISVYFLGEAHHLVANLLLQDVWEGLSEQYGLLPFLRLGNLHGAHYVEALALVVQLLLPQLIDLVHVSFIQLLVLAFALLQLSLVLKLQLKAFVADALEL